MNVYWQSGLALVLSLLSALLLYLGSPNQQWFKKRYIKFYPALLLSLILLCAAWWLLRSHLSGLSAVFTIFTALMLLLGLLPFTAKLSKPSTKGGKSTLVRSKSYAEYQTKWWSRVLGALVLGFPLALFTSSLIGLTYDVSEAADVRAQFIMWMITPLWLMPLCFIFFTHKPWRVFLSLLILSACLYGVLGQVGIGG
ncbi:hypothetical protein [Bowmanella denitrificans]|uniref:hypothetical protein n=1 Tax=Bowmanella denitrificans TaxID=366582 RepID=UPI000C99D590|nr:hypothetical protein [Bowmanella denitrificans]